VQTVQCKEEKKKMKKFVVGALVIAFVLGFYISPVLAITDCEGCLREVQRCFSECDATDLTIPDILKENKEFETYLKNFLDNQRQDCQISQNYCDTKPASSCYSFLFAARAAKRACEDMKTNVESSK
jgi:hypothetical protein